MSTAAKSHSHGRRAARRRELSPRSRAVGIVAWCSFLAAGAGTTVTFAFLDPAMTPLEAVPFFWQSRSAIYAIGFFILWGMSAFAAALTLYMVRTSGGKRA